MGSDRHPAAGRQDVAQADSRRRRLMAEIVEEARLCGPATGRPRLRDEVLQAMREVPREAFVRPSDREFAYRMSLWGDEIERIQEIDALTGEHAILKRVLLAWKAHAPSNALSGGFAACSPDDLSLVPRAVLTKDEVALAQHDPDEGAFAVRGLKMDRVEPSMFSMAWSLGSEDKLAALKEIGALGLG
jgi:hypothetical protein